MKTNSLKLEYEGSVKRVWSRESNPGSLYFEFTDDYSVFDWGKMPDAIKNKGLALTIVGAYLFDRLSKPEFWRALPLSPHLEILNRQWLSQRFDHPAFHRLESAGAASHYLGLTQGNKRVMDVTRINAGSTEPLMMEVMRAEVSHPVPRHIMGNTIYFYNNKSSECRLIPLELVFRFGMPAGSSLKERLSKDPGYAKILGLSRIPDDHSFFEHPIIELFTKLEPKDRFLSWQEAALMAHLDPQTFENMLELTFDYALALFVIFKDRGIELWDGKIEMVLSEGELMLADSIGPDELRLVYRDCQLSKEMIRQVYRGSKWEVSIKEAQALAKSQPGKSWKNILKDDMKTSPEPLPASSKAAVDKLYGVITNHLIDSPVFVHHPTLDDYVTSVPPSLMT